MNRAIRTIPTGCSTNVPKPCDTLTARTHKQYSCLYNVACCKQYSSSSNVTCTKQHSNSKILWAPNNAPTQTTLRARSINVHQSLVRLHIESRASLKDYTSKQTVCTTHVFVTVNKSFTNMNNIHYTLKYYSFNTNLNERAHGVAK